MILDINVQLSISAHGSNDLTAHDLLEGDGYLEQDYISQKP